MIKKLETILIGTSLTEASDPVVQSGVLLARRSGAKVHLAHAYAAPMTYSGAPFFPDSSIGEVFKAERAALQRQLDNQIARLGIERTELAGIHLEVSPAHRYLVETAGKIGADLIVVGSSESPRLAKQRSAAASLPPKIGEAPTFTDPLPRFGTQLAYKKPSPERHAWA